MIHKTKAAMQGRQCHYQKLKQSQDTRVNAGGQSLSAPVITGTAPLAQFGFQIRTALQYVSQEGSDFKSRPLRVTKSHAHPQTTQKLGCLGCTAMQHTQSPKISGDTITEIVIVGLGATAVGDTTEKSRSFDRYPNIGYRCEENRIGQNQSYKNSGGNLIFCEPLRVAHKLSQRYSVMGAIQPFGSIPCRRNSARANSFIQLPRLIPSRSAASLSCWRNSGVIRIWKVGDSPSPFGVLSRLIVDMYVRNLLTWILLCTYVNTSNMQKTTPRSAGTLPRRLTKPLSEVTAMAFNNSTQTRPEFTWRFLSASERYPTAKPLVIYVNASSEQEARDTMPGVNLIFAARLPFHDFRVVEVRHA